MSSSTTCGLFWVNTDTNSVTERVNDIKATCTADFTSCSFPSSFGRDKFSCTQNLMYPATVASDSKSGYICGCGSEGLAVPNTNLVSCTDDCYKLEEEKQCTILRLSLNSNPTFADTGMGKIDSQECVNLRCGTGKNSEICTDKEGSYQYSCNDGLVFSLLDTSKGYACACGSKGVIVPNGFGVNVFTQINECKGKKAPSGGSSDNDDDASSTADASGSSASATGSSLDAESTASGTASADASASVQAGGSGAATVTLSLKNVISLVGASLVIMGTFA